MHCSIVSVDTFSRTTFFEESLDVLKITLDPFSWIFLTVMVSGVAKGRRGRGGNGPPPTPKKVYIGKFVKISKVCRIIEENFQVLPLHKKIAATPLVYGHSMANKLTSLGSKSKRRKK